MDLHERTINALRLLPADMVQKANSGHPGAPMGMAPMAYALWMHTLKHDPGARDWPDRDRFVLSNGHASALLYSLLHLCGYPLSMDDLQQFRQWGSKTPGHPEYGVTEGVETTTGPLGQGLANAVGFAIAETMLAAHFNREGFPLVNHRSFALCGDGCLMEGIGSEACSLAGTLKLSKLTILYDDNSISIEGSTDLAFREDVGARFEAYGWQVVRVEDGNDYRQILTALEQTRDSDRPSLIVCPTTIGYGSPSKAGKASAHGEPLGDEDLRATRRLLGAGEKPFEVDSEVYAHISTLLEKNRKARTAWEALFARYRDAYPDLAAEWDQWHGILDLELLSAVEGLWSFEGKAATRVSSGMMINRLAKQIPNLVGGSADLAPSNKTAVEGGGSYSAENRAGRNMHFGVREHAMAAISNGMALHGGIRVFCGTFLVFSDYMKGAMRMSALMGLPIVYVLTHDSIGVGEDGATHQPVEQLTALRSIPGMTVFRPADSRETAAAWLWAVTAAAPTSLVLTRQNLPLFDQSGADALKGGYILDDSKGDIPALLLIASGSEVALAMDAKAALAEKGIDARVVSMPSMEVFLQQDAAYRESVIPSHVRKRVAIEAGSGMAWHKFTGLDGQIISLDHFGASAPAETLFEKFGFTTDHVVQTALSLFSPETE